MEKWRKVKESILEDIKKNPENHRHEFCALMACCAIEGTVYTDLIDAHAKYAGLGTNGGVKCDVWTGHCACGARHYIEDGKRK